MEINSNREERFVLKLIQDTKKKVIEWTDEPNNKLVLPSNERAISKVYKTKIDDKDFRIYEYQTKYFKDEDDWDWVERIRLEVFDTDGASLFDFEYDYSLSKLFSAVRRANTDIDNFMKGFLNE